MARAQLKTHRLDASRANFSASLRYLLWEFTYLLVPVGVLFTYNEVAQLRWVVAFLDDMLAPVIYNCVFPACLWGFIQNRICFYIKAGVVHKCF